MNTIQASSIFVSCVALTLGTTIVAAQARPKNETDGNATAGEFAAIDEYVEALKD